MFRHKNQEQTEDHLTVEQWLQIRRDEGAKINPETAEVQWFFAQTLDPYGVQPDIPDEYQQIGRAYFARNPGNDIWVWFGDLPVLTGDRLWEMHRSNLAFPTGLPSGAFYD